MFNVITVGRPLIVKTMDHDASFWQGIKNAYPEVFLVGRIWNDDYPLSDPIETANRVANDILGNPCRNIYDAWEGLNERPVEELDALCRFEIHLAAILHANGLKYVGFSWSEGVPDFPHWQDGRVQAACRAVDYIGVHEYNAPRMDTQVTVGLSGQLEGWHLLRYRKWYKLLPKDCKQPLIISECGIDGKQSEYYEGGKTGWKDFTNALDYVNQLIWYARELEKDTYVLGATIFNWGTLSDEWVPYDLGGQVIDGLYDFWRGEPVELPPEVSIAFWADKKELAVGECTTVHWDVEGVKAVFYQGAGVTGHGSREECPISTHTYTLTVIFVDDTSFDYTLTITVGEPLPPPLPPLPETPLAQVAYWLDQVGRKVQEIGDRVASIPVVNILLALIRLLQDDFYDMSDACYKADVLVAEIIQSVTERLRSVDLSDAIQAIFSQWNLLKTNPTLWVMRRITEISQEAVDFIYSPNTWIRNWLMINAREIWVLWRYPDEFFRDAWDGRFYTLYYLYTDPGGWLWDALWRYIPSLHWLVTDPDGWFRDAYDGRFYTLYYLYTDPGGWLRDMIYLYLPTVAFLLTDPLGWLRTLIISQEMIDEEEAKIPEPFSWLRAEIESVLSEGEGHKDAQALWRSEIDRILSG